MRLIRLKEVINLTALSRSSIYKKMNEGTFPKTVSLGDRAVAWVESDINEWIDRMVQQSRQD
ncbi:AlpA family transcriptional regulator [Vibrio gangliei]|uniref:AlpA family transcriptional regulator n=1 Tax=Vibrio gangliei TaxID=2077090 RepID=UPI000D01F517|nr:AlpA family transcriptional regulator [Vibrio gangliei]